MRKKAQKIRTPNEEKGLQNLTLTGHIEEKNKVKRIESNREWELWQKDKKNVKKGERNL